MGSGRRSAGRPHPTDTLHYAAVLLAGALAAVHVYLGVFVEPFGGPASVRFLLVAAGFIAGVAVYLTSYFRPVLYLLGALYAVLLALLWVFGGMAYFALGVATGALGAAFLVLTTYLFVREADLGG